MAFANLSTPNLPDFLQFIANIQQIGPGLCPPPLAAPTAPTLTAGGAGNLPSGTVFVTVVYVTSAGQTTASAESSIAVTGPTGSVTVASPPAVSGATGFNVYAAPASGAEALQTPAPVTIGAACSLIQLASGTAAPPLVNTSGSPFPGYALNDAIDRVISVPGVSAVGYTMACYNCAAHILLGILPAQEGTPIIPEARKRLGYRSGNFGVVASAGDQGTSESLAIPDALKQLTLDDLQFIQTPWGRAYVAWNQAFGDIFGLS